MVTSGGCGLPGAGQRRGLEQPNPLGVGWCATGAAARTILLDGGRSRLGPHRAGRPPGWVVVQADRRAPDYARVQVSQPPVPSCVCHLGALVGRVSWPDRALDGPERRARHRGRCADGSLVVVMIDQLKIVSPLSGQTWPLERVP